MKKISLLFLLILLVSLFTYSGSGLPTIPAKSVDHIYSDDDSDNSTRDDGDKIKDEDHDGVENDKETAYEREIEKEVDAQKFKIKSSLKNDTNKDEFELSFDSGSDDQAEIAMKFQSESGNVESELKYEIKFDEIVEFVDTNAFGYKNETVLTRYEIGKVGWLPLQFEENLTSGLIKLNATTSDGVFGLIMRLSNNFLVDENVTISPTSLKIDVIINNFPYASSGTKLAVKTVMKSESEMKVDNTSEDELEGIAKNESEVELSLGSSSAFFSWSEVASVDGSLVNVLASSLADSSSEEGVKSNKMYYTFNATDASQIVWDPKVGVVSQASKTNYEAIMSPVAVPAEVLSSVAQDPTVGALSGFEFFAVISLFGFILLRRRRK